MSSDHHDMAQLVAEIRTGLRKYAKGFDGVVGFKACPVCDHVYQDTGAACPNTFVHPVPAE